MSVAALTVLSAVAVFAALGGIGLANGVISVAQDQYGHDKVTICHNGHTITISKRAWPAHKRHGDTQGSCAEGRHDKKGKDENKRNAKHENKGDTHHGTTTTTTTTSPTTTTPTDTHDGDDGDDGDDDKGHGNGNGNGGGNAKGHGHDK
jgi:hypothetical protein